MQTAPLVASAEERPLKVNLMKIIWTFVFVSALACALNCEAAGPQQYYPAPALKACLAGVTSVRCTLAADGTLGDCSIVSETPTSGKFGQKRTMAPRPRAGVCKERSSGYRPWIVGRRG
jgi:hypothetical protein